MEYSAGLTSKPFWYLESLKTAHYMLKGLSREEIKEIAVKENIYQVAKEYRAIEILNGTYSRLSLLPKEMLELLEDADVSTAKVIVLTSAMMSNRILFEFLNEVFREKIIIGDLKIEDRDVNIFFNRKIEQSDVVAAWTDVSIRKLKVTFTKYLAEAGLLSDAKKDRKILQPLLSYKLKAMYEENKMMIYYNAITAEE